MAWTRPDKSMSSENFESISWRAIWTIKTTCSTATNYWRWSMVTAAQTESIKTSFPVRRTIMRWRRPEHTVPHLSSHRGPASTRAEPQSRLTSWFVFSCWYAGYNAPICARVNHGYVIVTKQRTSGRQTVAQVSFPLVRHSSLTLFLCPFLSFSASLCHLLFPFHFTSYYRFLHRRVPSLFVRLSPTHCLPIPPSDISVAFLPSLIRSLSSSLPLPSHHRVVFLCIFSTLVSTPIQASVFLS